MSLGVKDARYTKMLMAELRPHKKISYIDGRCDNTAAIDIIKAHGLTARSKHFERWAAYVRDAYQRGILTLKHCTTDRMIADIFTKALPHDAVRRMRPGPRGVRPGNRDALAISHRIGVVRCPVSRSER